MVKLFTFYFDQEGGNRIDKSSTMRKYKEAYLEAASKIKNIEYYNLLRINKIKYASYNGAGGSGTQLWCQTKARFLLLPLITK